MANKKDGKSIISSFKKFSELTHSKKVVSEQNDTNEKPFTDKNIPANHNIPNNNSKVERPSSIKYMQPQPVEKSEEQGEEETEEVKEKVNFYGKVAKLPKGTKASKGYNFLENVKVPKSSIWYIMVEKQDNELQMVKYNNKKGVDLSKFISDLKTYYISKYKSNTEVCGLIENIHIDGNDTYSRICNIPLIEVDGKKAITKITEDLIKLLSK